MVTSFVLGATVGVGIFFAVLLAVRNTVDKWVDLGNEESYKAACKRVIRLRDYKWHRPITDIFQASVTLLSAWFLTYSINVTKPNFWTAVLFFLMLGAYTTLREGHGLAPRVLSILYLPGILFAVGAFLNVNVIERALLLDNAWTFCLGLVLGQAIISATILFNDVKLVKRLAIQDVVNTIALIQPVFEHNTKPG
jgi:hypothetical protein